MFGLILVILLLSFIYLHIYFFNNKLKKKICDYVPMITIVTKELRTHIVDIHVNIQDTTYLQMRFNNDIVLAKMPLPKNAPNIEQNRNGILGQC